MPCLSGLQDAFDSDYASHTFHTNNKGWYNNASADAIFAYKLLVQTGNTDGTVDYNQITKVRLVSKEGIIYPPAFYNYLTAWIANDALAYSYSMGEIRPKTQSWEHDPFDYDTQSEQTFQFHDQIFLKMYVSLLYAYCFSRIV